MDADQIGEVMKAIKQLLEVHHIDDYVYHVRERELKGWDGPLVQGFAAACNTLRAAVKDYFG